MRKLRLELTELEGAVLTEIGFRGNFTAFRVRRAFEASPSANWRGSAGAVYQAIRRLVGRGLIHTEPLKGKRGGNRLSVSAQGDEVLKQWLCDPQRACDVGFDPFRLRAGLWRKLTRSEREQLAGQLDAALGEELARLNDYVANQDDVERAEVELAIQLLDVRKKWLSSL